jgi:hypothetical protein
MHPHLGDGRMRAVRLLDGLGILDNRFHSAGQGFVARISSPRHLLRFAYVLSEGDTEVRVDGQRERIVVNKGISSLSYVPGPMENIIPGDFLMRNFCVMVAPAFFYRCWTSSTA